MFHLEAREIAVHYRSGEPMNTSVLPASPGSGPSILALPRGLTPGPSSAPAAAPVTASSNNESTHKPVKALKALDGTRVTRKSDKAKGKSTGTGDDET